MLISAHYGDSVWVEVDQHVHWYLRPLCVQVVEKPTSVKVGIPFCLIETRQPSLLGWQRKGVPTVTMTPGPATEFSK